VTDGYPSFRAMLPGPVKELVASIRNPAGQLEVLHLLFGARLLEPVLIDAATATTMARPYAWRLDRIGAKGIKLTSADYLRRPPARTLARWIPAVWHSSW